MSCTYCADVEDVKEDGEIEKGDMEKDAGECDTKIQSVGIQLKKIWGRSCAKGSLQLVSLLDEE
jgi:hypothetical protein